jgi:hypothetical protein
MPGAPRQIVDGPQFTPTPYGLLSVVQWPPPGDHWQGGVTYEVTVGNPAITVYDECISVTGTGQSPPPMPTLPGPGNVQRFTRGATKFEVACEFDCSSAEMADTMAIAESALSMLESWAVERAFWTGFAGLAGSQAQTVHPHLASNTNQIDSNQGPVQVFLETAATIVSGGALFNAVEALGALEGALANIYTGVGVIHIPQMALPTFDAWGLVDSSGPVMRTRNGNLVAIGAGYPGTSPAGVVPPQDQCWIYATGQIMARRTEAQIRPVGAGTIYDKAKGTWRAIAERNYCLGWDYGHVAVLTALGAPKGT